MTKEEVLNIIPRIKAIKMMASKCYHCHTYYDRWPAFWGGVGEFSECDKCGCTSFTEYEGRPVGRRSVAFNDMIEKLKSYLIGWDYLSEEEQQRCIDSLII